MAAAEKPWLAAIVDLLFISSVNTGRLQKNHRIWIANGRNQQPIGLSRRRRNHDAQTGNMGKHGFDGFRMVLWRMNAAAMGYTQDQRASDASLCSRAQARGMIG